MSEDDLTDEALLAFLQGYAKTSLKGDNFDLNFLRAEIEYQMNLMTGLRTSHANATRLSRQMGYSRSLTTRQERRSGDK
jgi:hypothetical protein